MKALVVEDDPVINQAVTDRLTRFDSHPGYKDQAKYEESLRKEARACLDGKVRR